MAVVGFCSGYCLVPGFSALYPLDCTVFLSFLMIDRAPIAFFLKKERSAYKFPKNRFTKLEFDRVPLKVPSLSMNLEQRTC
jgi:hypothetical protein